MDNNNVFYSVSFNDCSDEDIVKRANLGDKRALEYLLSKYRELVNMKVGKYFIIGAEKEDIIQEGLIGLYKSIKNFDDSKHSSFKSFANLCIERQLITAIKTSNRQKHIPLNSYLSLNNSAYSDEDDSELIEFFNSETVEDPLETITKKEYYKNVENIIEKNLSSFEKEVLSGFIQGESYIDIANRLNIGVKSVDNAIQRIRRKAIKNITDK